jgi:alpha-glucosidase
MDHIRAQGDLLSFTRRVDGEAIHCAFNLGGQRHTHKCPVGDVLLAVNEADNGHLPPWGAIIIRETSA